MLDFFPSKNYKHSKTNTGRAQGKFAFLPVRFGIFPERLPGQVLVRLRLGGDALRPAGPRPDKLRAGQDRLAFVQFPLQLLDLVLAVREPPLQVPYPLLLEQQDLGKVVLQLAHGWKKNCQLLLG